MAIFNSYVSLPEGTRPGYVNSLLLKMAIEIVDLPIENGGSFHSYVNVYQRVVGNEGMIHDH